MKFKQLELELVQIDTGKKKPKPKSKPKSKSTKPKLPSARGCDNCSLNKVKGIKKIFGKIEGKSIMVWGQSPGPKENKEGKELLGPSGEFWWKEAHAAGIDREDCDIQNVVRCFPADIDEDTWPPLRMRDPSKLEIHCCSIYNDQAVVNSKAKIHIVLGQIAAKILLGQEYTKDRRVFWSKKLRSKVVCLDHPNFFLKRGV